MPRLTHQNPRYRKHRASGQALVTLDGQDHYLGTYGTKASRADYDRLIAEWLAAGRRLPNDNDLDVNEVCAAFWRFAQGYYRSADGPSGELDNYRLALRPLKRLYGPTLARDFGPLALKALRGEMVRLGWCRNVVNRQAGRIRFAFKWAVSEQLVPAAVYQGLQAVSGLRKGRSEARESEPVKPVPDERVEAVRPLVSPQVRAMIDLQLLTGMRPAEVCLMRGLDLDTTGKLLSIGKPLWTYKPARHKTEHHNHDRTIYFGPKAQDALRPLLLPDLSAYLFSPMEAEKRRRDELSAARTTPETCGNTTGTNRKRHPKRRPGDRYDVASYRRAIARACDRAFPVPLELARRRVQGTGRNTDATRWEAPAEWKARLGKDKWAELQAWQEQHRWHPHQLRHNAGTRLRKEFGLEAAQVILGHRTLSVTEIYAEKNVAAAQRIMAEAG